MPPAESSFSFCPIISTVPPCLDDPLDRQFYCILDLLHLTAAKGATAEFLVGQVGAALAAIARGVIPFADGQGLDPSFRHGAEGVVQPDHPRYRLWRPP